MLLVDLVIVRGKGCGGGVVGEGLIAGGGVRMIKRLEGVVYRWLMNALTLLTSAAYVISEQCNRNGAWPVN